MRCPACGTLAVEGVRACAACATPLLPAPAIAAGRAAVPGAGWPDWETGAGVRAYLEAAAGVLVAPGRSFAEMRRVGGVAAPLAFALSGALLLVPAAVLWRQLLVTAVSPESGPGAGRLVLDALATAMAFAMTLWIGAGIRHGLLLLMGAARWPFEVTFRAGCYVRGSTAPLMLVPVLGFLIVPAANFVLDVVALRRTQESSVLEAVLAAGLPAAVAVTGQLGGLALLLTASAAGGWG